MCGMNVYCFVLSSFWVQSIPTTHDITTCGRHLVQAVREIEYADKTDERYWREDKQPNVNYSTITVKTMTNNLGHPSAPNSAWLYRIIRGPGGNYKTCYYKTENARDRAAQRFANRDGTSVSAELWSQGHPQDDLNRGWACDAFFDPQ